MLKNFLSIVLIVISVPMQAQNKIVLQVTNFESSKGVCRACLFNNAADFNGKGGKAYQCKQVVVTNKTALVAFENIPAGNFAISVFHDENNNNKLDLNFLGIPKEGYGASKNKLPFASAPDYKENSFVLPDKGVTNLSIRLRNL